MDLEELRIKALAQGQKDMVQVIDTFKELIERCEKAEAKLSEMEKQEPVGYAVEVYYQSMIDPSNCGEGLEIYSVEDFDKTDRSKDDENVFPVYALPVPQQSAGLKRAAKLYIDENVWDGEDRVHATNDEVRFNPAELQEFVFDLLESLPPITK